MNEWRDSDWFKTWLALARSPATETNAMGEQYASRPAGQGQISQKASHPEQTQPSEWEIAE